MQALPGTMDQATFAHRLYQNFIDVIDVCLKCEMEKRKVDFLNPVIMSQKLNKKVPPGSKDMLVGTFYWDNEEILSVERHDGNLEYSWSYVIKSAQKKEEPKQGFPQIVYT